ncbi:hypothetical protein OAU50_08975, partial [Planctomycetota bacterium]|nr:hypothetical protein [Planctomycetota bacterium]
KSYFSVNLNDAEQVSQIDSSTMKDKEVIRFQAADTLISSNSNMKRMREWFTQKHFILSNVKTETKWKEQWKPFKEIYEKADGLKEFADGDLEKFGGQASGEAEEPENPEGESTDPEETETPEESEGTEEPEGNEATSE